MTKVYIVKLFFQETMVDTWAKVHKGFFNKEEAEIEKFNIHKTYSNPPECPLPEGEDEYYDRIRIGLTSPDEDLLMGEWEETIANTEGYSHAFIEEVEVY